MANKRIQSEAVAELLGVTPRMVRQLAQRGELPSAAKIGSVWTFDRARIEEWLREKEREAARRHRDFAPFRPDLDHACQVALGLRRPGSKSAAQAKVGNQERLEAQCSLCKIVAWVELSADGYTIQWPQHTSRCKHKRQMSDDPRDFQCTRMERAVNAAQRRAGW